MHGSITTQEQLPKKGKHSSLHPSRKFDTAINQWWKIQKIKEVEKKTNNSINLPNEARKYKFMFNYHQ